MSDGPDLPEAVPPPPPPNTGIWARYVGAATWVKIAIPVVIVIALIGLGVIIADAVGNDSSSDANSSTTSTTSPHTKTALLLLAAAQQLANEQETPTTTTTIETTTIPIPTTQEEATTEPATTEPATTEPATTEPATTTTKAPVTTVPVTEPTTAVTIPTTPPTEPTTVPKTTSTKPEATTEPTTEPTTEAETTTEAKTTVPETTTTEPVTTTTIDIPLPPGQLAVSPDAFRVAWNVAARGTGVATISAWIEKPLAGNSGNGADLGGNIRLVLLSDDPSGPVAEAVLGWTPLTDPGQEAAQNQAFQQAFAVLVKTVNVTVTDQEQATVASQLGLTSSTPPFPEGTSATATLGRQQYDLEAVTPAGQSGVYTLIGVNAS